MRSAGRRVHRAVEGDSIVATLALLRGQHDRLEVHASGRVDGVRLDGGPPRTGAHLVLSLTGSATALATTLTIVCRAADGMLVGGVLDDARAIDLELSVELLDVPSDVESAAGGEPVTKKPMPSAKSLTWQQVAEASARVVPPDEDEDESAPMPKLGDIIEHATFGTCSVAKVEADEEFIMVRTPANRVLRLSLDVLRLELVSTDENGRHSFRARARAK